MNGNRISLKVATEVSELDFAKNPDMPSLNTRRAETTVDLVSGQSFAIAGLMQNSSSQNMAKMPGMGSVPGAEAPSFYSFKRGQSELVIIVTPAAVTPMNGRSARTPVDQYVPPNDFERILLGRFQGSAKASQVQNRIGNRRLIGQSGFVFKYNS